MPTFQLVCQHPITGAPVRALFAVKEDGLKGEPKARLLRFEPPVDLQLFDQWEIDHLDREAQKIAREMTLPGEIDRLDEEYL
jgi:hypothetical protein